MGKFEVIHFSVILEVNNIFFYCLNAHCYCLTYQSQCSSYIIYFIISELSYWDPQVIFTSITVSLVHTDSRHLLLVAISTLGSTGGYLLTDKCPVSMETLEKWLLNCNGKLYTTPHLLNFDKHLRIKFLRTLKTLKTRALKIL